MPISLSHLVTVCDVVSKISCSGQKDKREMPVCGSRARCSNYVISKAFVVVSHHCVSETRRFVTAERYFSKDSPLTLFRQQFIRPEVSSDTQIMTKVCQTPSCVFRGHIGNGRSSWNVCRNLVFRLFKWILPLMLFPSLIAQSLGYSFFLLLPFFIALALFFCFVSSVILSFSPQPPTHLLLSLHPHHHTGFHDHHYHHYDGTISLPPIQPSSSWSLRTLGKTKTKIEMDLKNRTSPLPPYQAQQASLLGNTPIMSQIKRGHLTVSRRELT